jgi:hypothetical protein
MDFLKNARTPRIESKPKEFVEPKIGTETTVSNFISPFCIIG